MSQRRVVLCAVFVGSLLVPIVQSTPVAATNANARPDFDNDGYADLVIPDAFADVGLATKAGGVHVLDGSPTGPRAIGSQFWTQDSPGMPNAAESNDRFGFSWAAGDFDGDGNDDLAVGSTREGVGGVAEAGAVDVIYGGPGGLTSVGAQEFHQNTPGIPGSNEASDMFSSRSMAAGDFDGDGYDELAIGAAREDLGAKLDAGAVWVIPGSPTGLQAMGTDFLTQDTPGVVGASEVLGNWSANALRAGDFDNDGNDDLLVPALGVTVGGAIVGGAFWVFPGGPGGLSGATSEYWSEDTPGVPGSAETGNQFGGATAVGDFDNDGYDDAAIGASGETVNSKTNAGEVYVFYGSAMGLRTAGIQRWNLDTPGIIGTALNFDGFSFSSLAAGDFDNDGRADLAIGASYRSVGAVVDAGTLNVLYGTGASGIGTGGNQQFTQDTPGVLNAAETSDYFTEGTLFVADFDGDGRDDLWIPVGFENIAGITDAGGGHVVFGAGAAGLGTAGNMFITHDTPGIVGMNTNFRYFGRCCN